MKPGVAADVVVGERLDRPAGPVVDGFGPRVAAVAGRGFPATRRGRLGRRRCTGCASRRPRYCRTPPWSGELGASERVIAGEGLDAVAVAGLRLRGDGRRRAPRQVVLGHRHTSISGSLSA